MTPHHRQAHAGASNHFGFARAALFAGVRGSSFLWIKLALRGFSPVEVALRIGLGALVLLPQDDPGGIEAQRRAGAVRPLTGS